MEKFSEDYLDSYLKKFQENFLKATLDEFWKIIFLKESNGVISGTIPEQNFRMKS